MSDYDEKIQVLRRVCENMHEKVKSLRENLELYEHRRKNKELDPYDPKEVLYKHKLNWKQLLSDYSMLISELDEVGFHLDSQFHYYLYHPIKLPEQVEFHGVVSHTLRTQKLPEIQADRKQFKEAIINNQEDVRGIEETLKRFSDLCYQVEKKMMDYKDFPKPLVSTKRVQNRPVEEILGYLHLGRGLESEYTFSQDEIYKAKDR